MPLRCRDGFGYLRPVFSNVVCVCCVKYSPMDNYFNSFFFFLVHLRRHTVVSVCIAHIFYRQLFFRLYEWPGAEFLLQWVGDASPDLLWDFWKFQVTNYFSHLYCVPMIQLSLKEPSWWVDVFWVFQELFSVYLFYFLVCTCVVHKRCHHLIVTACTCQNNTNKTDLKVKSRWLFWVIIICETSGLTGLLGVVL